MAVREISCSNCSRSFNVNFPEGTTRAEYNKYDNKDTIHHNIERKLQCQNCEQETRIYYVMLNLKLKFSNSWSLPPITRASDFKLQFCFNKALWLAQGYVNPNGSNEFIIAGRSGVLL
jgi:transcription elongation factor Elf1